MNTLEALIERAGPADTDREAWLNFRLGGVTATEVRDLALKGASFKADLLASKRTKRPFEDLSHIPAVAHGKAREPVLEAFARGFGIDAERRVFAGVNARHLASPDGLGLDFDDQLIGFEGKTSKHPISYAESAGYFDQIQWCMHVTAARKWVLVWEQHNDFKPLPITYQWVERDDTRISELVRIADEFLAELDQPREFDLKAIRAARTKYWAAKTREDKAKADKESAAEELRELIGVGAVDVSGYRVTVSATAGRTSFDGAAFKEADPETYSKYLKTGAPGKPQVRVTPIKKETKK